MFEAWQLRQQAVKDREEALRARLRQLDDERRRRFYAAWRPGLKDPDTYATLNWLMLAGLHHYYLGRYARGTVNLLAMLAGLGLFAVAPLAGLALLAAVVVVELPALFRSQLIVEDHNVRLGERTLRRLFPAGH